MKSIAKRLKVMNANSVCDKDLNTLKISSKFWLTKDVTHYRLEVYNARLANQINSLVKMYKDDTKLYKFKNKEEAIFKIEIDRDVMLSKVMKIISRKAW